MKKKLFLCSALALCIFGANTIVKAESYIADSAPDTFTTNLVGRGYENGQLTNTQNDAALANVSISSLGQNVIDYHTSDKKKVFCIDRLISYNPNGGVVYTKKTDETVEYPIVYMIANSEKYYKEVGVTDVSEDIQKLEQSWLTQAAIWIYNAEKKDDDNFEMIQVTAPEIWEEGIQVNTYTSYVYSNRTVKLWAKARQMVSDAKAATDPSSVASLNFNYDGGHSLDKENKVIKTNTINLKTSGIVSYSLDLSNAPTGTKVYNEYNQEISDLTKVNVARFYLVVPVENVDNYTYEFNIPVKTNSYTYYKGYKYTSGSDQPLTLVTKEVKELDTTITVKASYIEDTASVISSSIYFVGFLILVSGVAIIYVNTRKKEQQI